MEFVTFNLSYTQIPLLNTKKENENFFTFLLFIDY